MRTPSLELTRKRPKSERSGECGIDSLLVINEESQKWPLVKIGSLQNFEPPSSWRTDRMVVCRPGLEQQDHVLPRGRRDETLHATLHGRLPRCPKRSTKVTLPTQQPTILHQRIDSPWGLMHSALHLLSPPYCVAFSSVLLCGMILAPLRWTERFAVDSLALEKLAATPQKPTFQACFASVDTGF
jgi:hypothetical protein